MVLQLCTLDVYATESSESHLLLNYSEIVPLGHCQKAKTLTKCLALLAPWHQWVVSQKADWHHFSTEDLLSWKLNECGPLCLPQCQLLIMNSASFQWEVHTMPLVSCTRHIDRVWHVQWEGKECLVNLSRFSWHGGMQLCHHHTYWEEFTSSATRCACVGSFVHVSRHSIITADDRDTEIL